LSERRGGDKGTGSRSVYEDTRKRGAGERVPGEAGIIRRAKPEICVQSSDGSVTREILPSNGEVARYRVKIRKANVKATLNATQFGGRFGDLVLVIRHQKSRIETIMNRHMNDRDISIAELYSSLSLSLSLSFSLSFSLYLSLSLSLSLSIFLSNF
jgi:hypothetical protein